MWGKKKKEPEAPPPKHDRNRAFVHTRVLMLNLFVAEQMAGKRNFAQTTTKKEGDEAVAEFLDACYQAGMRMGFSESECDYYMDSCMVEALKALTHNVGTRDNVAADLISLYEAAYKLWKAKTDGLESCSR